MKLYLAPSFRLWKRGHQKKCTVWILCISIHFRWWQLTYFNSCRYKRDHKFHIVSLDCQYQGLKVFVFQNSMDKTECCLSKWMAISSLIFNQPSLVLEGADYRRNVVAKMGFLILEWVWVGCKREGKNQLITFVWVAVSRWCPLNASVQ